MSASFTAFRGYGFWSRDAMLEVWLYFLAEEINYSLESVPGWLLEAQNHWFEQSKVGFVGLIDAHLDEFLIDDKRVLKVVQLGEQALERLLTQGSLLSDDYLNSLGTGGAGAYFSSDIRTVVFVEIGQAFVALLRGRLQTNASTSPILPLTID